MLYWRGQKIKIGGVLTALVLSVAMLTGSNVYATETIDVSVSENEPAVEASESVFEETTEPGGSETESAETGTEGTDSSEISYIYQDGSETVEAIDLKGNSVIITVSPTNEERINIYVDTNRDGEIDEGSTPVEIAGSTDLIAGNYIYGMNGGEWTTPIRITQKSGNILNMVVVNNAVLTVSGETAVTIDLAGGDAQGVTAVSGGKVVANGAAAVNMTVDSATMELSKVSVGYNSEMIVNNATCTGIEYDFKNGTTSTTMLLENSSYTINESTGTALHMNLAGGTHGGVYGLEGGQIISDGTNPVLMDVDVATEVSAFYGADRAKVDSGKNTNTAFDFDLTGNGAVTGTLYGIQGYSSSTLCPVIGHVDMNISPSADAEKSIGNIYGLNNYIELDGNLNFYMKNVKTSGAYGACNAHIKGNVDCIAYENNQFNSYFYGLSNAFCDKSVNVKVGNASTNTPSIYGVSCWSAQYETFVGGDVTFVYTGGKAGSVYPVDGYVSSGAKSKVNGNVDVDILDGEINYMYSVQEVSVAGTVNIDANALFTGSLIYGISNVDAAKDVTITMKNKDLTGQYSYTTLYGTYYGSTVAGNVSVTIDGGTASYLYGIYETDIKGNADVILKNINEQNEKYTNGYTSYGISYSDIDGNVTVDVDDSRFGTLYGTYGLNCKSEVAVTMDNVDVKNSMYGAELYSAKGIKCLMTDISASQVYGLRLSGNIGYEGDVTVSIKDAAITGMLYGIEGNSSNLIKGNVSLTMDNCVVGGTTSSTSSYGYCGPMIDGNLTVNVIGGSYGSKEATYTNYNTIVSGGMVTGDTTIDVTGTTYVGSVYVYQPYSNSSTTLEQGDAAITFENTTFEKGQTTSTTQFYVNPKTGQDVSVTLDTDLPDTYDVEAGYDGKGVIHTPNARYYGGTYEFEEDLEIETIYLSAGYIKIPKGVTVKATKALYCSGAYILLEGSLEGPFAGTTNDNGTYTDAHIYMNGGTLTQDMTTIGNLYYPLSLTVSEKGGTVTEISGYRAYSHKLAEGIRFGKSGSQIRYTIQPDTGYEIASATMISEGDAAASEMAVSGTTYSFTMPQKATQVNVEFVGKEIQVTKMVADPVAKLNVTASLDAPIYDFSTLAIKNDATDGEVTYKIDSTYGLPEGLSLVNGKIIGTPTVAYETGKKTVIHVTGRNGNTQEISLNVVVTAGDSKQESTEGRLVIDEENKTVVLVGNSVVIEAAETEGKTSIYLDEDRDGVSDYEKPAYTADLSEYTIYGTYELATKNQIRITMNSGTVGSIYGAYKGNITSSGESLSIYMNGGKINNTICMLSAATMTGYIKLMISQEAASSSGNVSSMSSYTSSYKGCYMQVGAQAQVYGQWVFDEDLTLTGLNLYPSARVTIEEGVTVTTESYLRDSGTVTLLRGTLHATYVSGTGKIVMQGGELPADSMWNYVYYPAELTKNLSRASVYFSGDYYHDNKTDIYYLKGYESVAATVYIQDIAGYDAYYQIGEQEPVLAAAGANSFRMPREKTKVTVSYVPEQISVEKTFADPTAVVGTSYTEEIPLYDFAALTISNDTTSTYGGSVGYRLKSGSVLPAGLTFVGGKIIGTPTIVNTEGVKAEFVITGRNGTTETLELTIKVQNSGYVIKDINDVVDCYIYSSSSTANQMRLNGNSVVIMPDPTNVSKSKVYLDEDHDGIADNNIPLMISGSASNDLNKFFIYGYSDTREPYEGDISITVKGGKLRSIFGTYGSSASSRAKVNGDIRVCVENVTMNYSTGAVYGAFYGDVQNVTLEVTGGSFQYTDLKAAHGSAVNGDVKLKLSDAAKFTYSSNGYPVELGAVSTSQVTGNVYSEVGMNSGCAFTSTKTGSVYYAADDSQITGSIYQILDGEFNPVTVYFAHESTVGGNVEVQHKAGSASTMYLSYDSVVTGDVRYEMAEDNVYASFTSLTGIRYGTINNLIMSVPDSMYTLTMNAYYNGATSDSSSTIKNATYINNKGRVTVGGVHTLDEDQKMSGLTLLDNAKVTIPEGVSLQMTSGNFVLNSGAVLTNKGELRLHTSSTGSSVAGTLDNYGTMRTSSSYSTYRYYITTTGVIINREDAVWDLAAGLNSVGKLVNYGQLDQTYVHSTYSYALGMIYSTKALNLNYNPDTYHTNYNSNKTKFYFAITADYPSHCVESVTLDNETCVTSGIEGDTNLYVKTIYSGDSVWSPFTVTLGEQLVEDIILNSVTYGPAHTEAILQADGTYEGKAQLIFEPITVTLNYEPKETVTPIALAKTSHKIETTDENTPLVVDKKYTYYNPLFDLSTIEINHDLETEGDVYYFVGSGSSLPTGFTLKDGKIYGTFMEATAEEMEIKFDIRGKNQTTAEFTLTLGAVAKAVPNWTIPTNLEALAGQTLADIELPYSVYGVYDWEDETISVGEVVTTVENMTLTFIPTAAQIPNYDWASVADSTGATFDGTTLTCNVSVKVCAGIPVYTVPENLTAVYGDTFGDVEIPAGDNEGTFEWIYSPTQSVGEVDQYIYYINYIPSNANYQKVTRIPVTLTVVPAKASYDKITDLISACDDTLADVELPDVNGGKYQWITQATTYPKEGQSYKLGFKPDDMENYDWTTVSGWDTAWKMTIFDVKFTLTHDYAEEQEYDTTYHWNACMNEECDSIQNKSAHLWDEGTIIDAATMEAAGLMEYSCACGAVYEKEIPKLTHLQHIYNGGWKFDEDDHWKQCTMKDCTITTVPESHDFNEGTAVSAPTATSKGVVEYVCIVCKYVELEYLTAQEWADEDWDGKFEENLDDEDGSKKLLPLGTNFEDPTSKAYYKVTTVGQEVAFVKPLKTNYTKISIPKTVTYNGVTYKVTSVASNACKNNKNLKTLVIGSNVKTIGSKAFYGCKKLSKVTIGKNVTSIGNSAFQSCGALTKVTVPSKVKTIGSKAFYGCKKLSKVTLGKNVTSIGNSAFQSCEALKKITIPSKVTKIGSKAFYNCKKLTSMIVKTTKLKNKSIGKNAFKNMGSSNYKKTTVKVPKKQLNAYKKLFVKAGLSKKAKIKK